MPSSRKIYSGFTLLELLASIVVMSVISATIMPVIASASDSYVVARQVRSTTEQAAFALDRVTRITRQAPIGANDTGLAVVSASVRAIEFSDGTGVQLLGTTLEMLVPGDTPVPLCFEVESFSIEYLADDGVTSTLGTPELTQRFVFTIVVDGVTLKTLVFPRVWIGQGAL